MVDTDSGCAGAELMNVYTCEAMPDMVPQGGISGKSA